MRLWPRGKEDGKHDLTHEFKGTPTEIGSQIWERICLPIVGKVSRDFSPQTTLGQIYGGFVVSALGAMTADFGHEQALSFAREMFRRVREHRAIVGRWNQCTVTHNLPEVRGGSGGYRQQASPDLPS